MLRLEFSLRRLPDDMTLAELHRELREAVLVQIEYMRKCIRDEDLPTIIFNSRTVITDKVAWGFLKSPLWHRGSKFNRADGTRPYLGIGNVKGADQFDWKDPDGFDPENLRIIIRPN